MSNHCDDLQKYLETLFSDLTNEFIEVRHLSKNGLPPGSSYFRSVAETCNHIQFMGSKFKGYEFYIGVCPRKEEEGTKESVSRVNVLYADLDFKDYKGGRDEASTKLKAFPFQPSMTVASGHGLHAYWRLKESETDKKRTEYIMKGIATYLQSDKSVADVARILRPPGTYNKKDPENPIEVRLLEHQPNIQYILEDFDVIMLEGSTLLGNDLSASVESKPQDWIVTTLSGLSEGNRNTSFASVIGKLRRDRFSPQEIMALLTPHAEKCDYPADELNKQVESMCKRYQHQARMLDKRKYLWSDLGNAERLVDAFGHDIKFCPEKGRWYIWDGMHWFEDKTMEIERFAKKTVRMIYKEAIEWPNAEERENYLKFARSCQTAGKINAIIGLVRSDPVVAIEAADFNKNEWLLNCRTGTIDLKTGNLQNHSRDDLITKLAPVDYDPDAKCPRVIGFIHEILQDSEQLIGYVQKMLGYGLTGSVVEQVLFFLFGKGANGKTTLMDLYRKALGDYSKKAAPNLLIMKRNESHPCEIADLEGARAVVTSEIEHGKRMAESLMKDITGEKKQKARLMRQDFFEFDATYKIFLHANHKPVIKGTDKGVWRRIKLIPFEYRVPDDKRDGHLLEKLEVELPGFLNWLIEGCLLWQSEGLGDPPSVSEAVQAYQCEMDTIGNFLDECCIEDPSSDVLLKNLYEAYKRWADEAGERVEKKRDFNDLIEERGFEKTRRSKDNQWIWRGLRLCQTENPDFPTNTDVNSHINDIENATSR